MEFHPPVIQAIPTAHRRTTITVRSGLSLFLLSWTLAPTISYRPSSTASTTYWVDLCWGNLSPFYSVTLTFNKKGIDYLSINFACFCIRQSKKRFEWNMILCRLCDLLWDSSVFSKLTQPFTINAHSFHFIPLTLRKDCHVNQSTKRILFRWKELLYLFFLDVFPFSPSITSFVISTTL